MLLFNQPQSESLAELTHQFPPRAVSASHGLPSPFLLYLQLFQHQFQWPFRLLAVAQFARLCFNSQPKINTLQASVFEGLAQAECLAWLSSPTLSFVSAMPCTTQPKFLPGPPPPELSCATGLWMASGTSFVPGCVQTCFALPRRCLDAFNLLCSSPFALLVTWTIPVTGLPTGWRQVKGMHFADSRPPCSVRHMVPAVLPQTWSYNLPAPESPLSCIFMLCSPTALQRISCIPHVRSRQNKLLQGARLHQAIR